MTVKVRMCTPSFALLLPQIVAREDVFLAQVEPPVADGRMGQTPAVVGRPKSSFQLIFLRRRGDQRHDAVLVLEIEVPSGISHRGWTRPGAALLFPHQLAGQKLDA